MLLLRKEKLSLNHWSHFNGLLDINPLKMILLPLWAWKVVVA